MSLFKKDENIECLWKVNLCEGDSEPLLNRCIVCNWNLHAKIWANGPLNACRSRTKQREEEMKTWKANSKAWEPQSYQLRVFTGRETSIVLKIKISVCMCVTFCSHFLLAVWCHVVCKQHPPVRRAGREQVLKKSLPYVWYYWVSINH